MKFTKLFFALAATASVALYSCSSEKPTEAAKVDSTGVAATYTIDTATSAVNWKGTMTGGMVYSHFGTVKLTEGSFSTKGNALTAGTFTVSLKTINPLDSGYTKERKKENLVGHLGAPDFFAVDSFPTATFVVKSVEGNVATGDLTVRGKTNEEKVTDIVITADSTSATATGKLVFNRQKYGVAYKAAMKDMVLSDDIELTIDIKAKK